MFNHTQKRNPMCEVKIIKTELVCDAKCAGTLDAFRSKVKSILERIKPHMSPNKEYTFFYLLCWSSDGDLQLLIHKRRVSLVFTTFKKDDLYNVMVDNTPCFHRDGIIQSLLEFSYQDLGVKLCNHATLSLDECHCGIA